MFIDSFLGDVNSSSQEQKVRVTSFLGAKNSCFVSCRGELVRDDLLSAMCLFNGPSTATRPYCHAEP
jgi:hypothetical protein